MRDAYLLVTLAACAGPLSSRVCVEKSGKSNIAKQAERIVADSHISSDGPVAVVIVNHAPELHDSSGLETKLRGELAERHVTVRDEAESERFLRVTLEKRQMYVEVVERASRRVLYLHEYALEFCPNG